MRGCDFEKGPNAAFDATSETYNIMAIWQLSLPETYAKCCFFMDFIRTISLSCRKQINMKSSRLEWTTQFHVSKFLFLIVYFLILSLWLLLCMKYRIRIKIMAAVKLTTFLCFINQLWSEFLWCVVEWFRNICTMPIKIAAAHPLETHPPKIAVWKHFNWGNG